MVMAINAGELVYPQRDSGKSAGISNGHHLGGRFLAVERIARDQDVAIQLNAMWSAR